MAETGFSPATWLDTLARGEARWAVAVRFLGVGGCFSLLLLSLALGFSVGLGFPPHVAQGLAHGLCIVPTYLCQRAITFRSNVSHKRGLLGYVAMQLPLLGFGSGLAWLLIAQLHWPRLVSLALIAASVATTSFLIQRSLIFAASKRR
jgi:putative flippase GtrA